MSSCPECGAALETPLGCAACGALLALPRNATPFELLALPLAFDVDRAEVERRVRRLGRLTHPDFFATRGADARARAESNTAALNAARETLLDDHARGDWLVRHLGGPDEGALRQMPQAFLAEVLEWNELLEEARRPPLDDTLRRRVVSLENELGERRGEVLERLSGLLATSVPRDPERLLQARMELNALRYLDRTLAEIEALQSGNPAVR